MRVKPAIVIALVASLIVATIAFGGDKEEALKKAIENYDLKGVDAAIKNKVDLNEELPERGLPLRMAEESGSLDLVKALIAGGAKVGRRGGDGLSSFDAAVATGHFHLLPVMFESGEKFEINSLRNGVSALMLAAKDGNAAAIELLLKKGADVDLESGDHRAALSYAIEGRHHAAVKALLNGKSDANKQGKGGRTPIHEAISTGDTDIVALLLQAGAKLSTKDSEELTPLAYAVKLNDQKVVSFLISKGATPKGDKSISKVVTESTPKEILSLIKG